VDVARIDPGFHTDHVLLVTVPLSSSTIAPDANLATFEALQRRFTALPGVVALGRSYVVPLSGGAWANRVRSDAPGSPTGQEASSLMNFVSPGYFSAMRMTLRAGRDISDTDTPTSPPIAIVNETAARTFFPGTDPLGHVIRIVQATGEPGSPITVVGVVTDAKYRSLKAPMPPTIFSPLSQIPERVRENTYAIRTLGPPDALRPAVIAAATSVGREIPLAFTTLQAHVDDAMVQDRMLAGLSGFFGCVALLLAMVGLYGSVSYRVAARRGEFGVRVALGANAGTIVRLVMRDVGAAVGVGIASGLALSLAVADALRTLLFGIGPYDPATIGAATLLLAAVASIAGLVPARRAAQVDPIAALRAE
jgi:predicted permease